MAVSASNMKEDFLEEDPEIRSQKFVLLSFLSPENVLENKDQFFFGEFLKQYEVDYKMKNLETFRMDQLLILPFSELTKVILAGL